MIFRQELAARSSVGRVRPAFEAIEETQRLRATGGWLVTQPDHGRIAGQLAAAFDARKVPNVSESVVRAISLHDIGWMPLDGDFNSPIESGARTSFVDSEPERFLQAWMGSIQAAQSTGPLGGLMVSAHFARLIHPYLERGDGTPAQRAQAEQFLQREAERVDRLLPHAGLPIEEIEALIAVLQFCDLASIYLCSNPEAPVELSQFLDKQVQLSFENGAYRMHPGLLDEVLVLEIPCVRFFEGRPLRELVPVKVV